MTSPSESCTPSSLFASDRAAQATRGSSALINFLGNVDARIEGAGESVLVSTIELERLRRRRTEVFMNYPAQVKSEFFGNEFAKQTFMPTDTGPGTRETTEATIRRLQEEGVFVAPSGDAPSGV